MRYFSTIILAVVLLVLGQACTERMICPAYQSAFIHDKDALKRQFSYFNEDSTPKVFEASKDRFLIIEPVSYHRKLRSLQTIAMTDIYPEVEEDSLEMDQDEFFLAEREDIDSTLLDTDSIYMISLKKETFNVEQELYLWYLKDYLVYPDVRLMQEQEALAAVEPEEEKVGFFKRLFGKKKKKEETDFEVETNATDIDDNIEGEEPPKEKKGLFGRKKKKNEEEGSELEDPGKKKKKKKNKQQEEEPEENSDPTSTD